MTSFKKKVPKLYFFLNKRNALQHIVSLPLTTPKMCIRYYVVLAPIKNVLTPVLTYLMCLILCSCFSCIDNRQSGIGYC